MGRHRRSAGYRRSEGVIGVPLDGEDRRLYFAHQNGQGHERVEGVGGLVQGEFERCCRGPVWKRRLLAVLEEHAGPALTARLGGVEARRGELRLEVADSAVRYELGLRWEQRLLAVLRSQLPSAGITAVRFVPSR